MMSTLSVIITSDKSEIYEVQKFDDYLLLFANPGFLSR